MSKIKFDLSEVKVLKLDGTEMGAKKEDLGKLLGNFLFNNTSTIEWDEYARGLHKGAAIEVELHELREMLAIFLNPGCTFSIALKVALRDYITPLLSTENPT
jgi:hypothetical protein